MQHLHIGDDKGEAQPVDCPEGNGCDQIGRQAEPKRHEPPDQASTGDDQYPIIVMPCMADHFLDILADKDSFATCKEIVEGQSYDLLRVKTDFVWSVALTKDATQRGCQGLNKSPAESDGGELSGRCIEAPGHKVVDCRQYNLICPLKHHCQVETQAGQATCLLPLLLKRAPASST